MDGPRGTICSAMVGPEGLSVVAVVWSGGGTNWGDHSVTLEIYGSMNLYRSHERSASIHLC